MDTHQHLFLKTLDDLREKMKNPGYNYIRACGLLRHLLLDNPSLLTLANKDYKMKIWFTVSKPVQLKEPLPGTVLEFNPIIATGTETHLVSLTAFLNIIILRFADINYRVVDIINGVAHELGGIHSYSKTNEVPSVLYPDGFVRIALDENHEYLTKSILSIGMATLKATNNLRLLIEWHSSTGGF